MLNTLADTIAKDYYAYYKKKLFWPTLIFSYIVNLKFRVVVRYRLQTYFFRKKGVLNRIISILIRNGNIKKYGVEIGFHSEIGSGLCIHHCNGIVVGEGVKAGENLNLYQNVTLGKKNGEYPTIENGVTIYAGAVVIGDIIIGDNVVIGANALISKDVPRNCVAYGQNRIKG